MVGPVTGTPHTIRVDIDGRYGHLRWVSCTCGWRIFGAVPQGVADVKIDQHTSDVAQQEVTT